MVGFQPPWPCGRSLDYNLPGHVAGLQPPWPCGCSLDYNFPDHVAAHQTTTSLAMWPHSWLTISLAMCLHIALQPPWPNDDAPDLQPPGLCSCTLHYNFCGHVTIHHVAIHQTTTSLVMWLHTRLQSLSHVAVYQTTASLAMWPYIILPLVDPAISCEIG